MAMTRNALELEAGDLLQVEVLTRKDLDSRPDLMEAALEWLSAVPVDKPICVGGCGRKWTAPDQPPAAAFCFIWPAENPDVYTLGATGGICPACAARPDMEARVLASVRKLFDATDVTSLVGVRK